MKTKIYCLLVALTFVLRVPAVQITNSVHITTNLIFYLKSTWKTNGPESQFKADDLISFGIIGTSTNNIGYRHFPSFPAGGNFDFHLFDGTGKEVAKTKAGLDFAGTPRKPTEMELRLTRNFFPYFVDQTGAEYRRLFRPEDVFMITNKGVYEMEIQIRLCVIMTNDLPDLKAMVDWRNIASHGYPFAKDFGVLTSPPLRVKVIKK